MKKLIFFILSFCCFYFLQAQVTLKSKIDSYEIKKEKEYQEFLQLKLKEWCSKKRNFEQYKYVESLDFWKEYNIKVIPDYEEDCRGYPFKLKSDTLLTIDVIIRVLIWYADD